jgi:hypothetical protein
MAESAHNPHPPYFVSPDPALLDLSLIHTFLTTSYWSPGIPRATVEKAVANSLPFGVYDPSSPRSPSDPRPSQVGFARVISDRATFAYLADVFILPAHRNRGLSKLLMQSIIAHPDLQNLRRFSLITRDAHTLYTQFGFTPLNHPDRHMERVAQSQSADRHASQG